jgi:hypothetical protein
MEILDLQMQQWSTRLRDDLKISSPDSNELATAIATEVRQLSDDVRREIKDASPISLKDRIDELIAFQRWMDIVQNSPTHPSIVRAQVITQNYICFVYLGDSCFKTLRGRLPTGSSTRRCCTYLTDNPVRAFRNAVAHANWRYKDDFSGIEYWARKGGDTNEPMVHWEVKQPELNFWQALARTTAYAAYLNL